MRAVCLALPCSASVDDQLEPLAALVQSAGGSPRDVLLAYPGIAVVPVAHLKGTRHVLRQLGVAGEAGLVGPGQGMPPELDCAEAYP